jgi:hypothetical protein
VPRVPSPGHSGPRLGSSSPATIGLIAAFVAGWALRSFLGVDSITSIWVAAVISAMTAISLRLVIGTFVFRDD